MGIVRSYTPGGHLRWERAFQVIGKSTQFQRLRVKSTTVTVAGVAGNAPTSPTILAARYRTDAKGTKVWGVKRIVGYPASWIGALAVDGSGNAVVSGVAYDLGSPALDRRRGAAPRSGRIPV